MDLPLAEYELWRRRSSRLARALPLSFALMVAVGIGLHDLGLALPAVLFAAAWSGIVAAHALILMPSWTSVPSARPDVVPQVEGLPQL